MFSWVTIAASTTIPMAIARAESEIMFIVCPAINKKIKVTIREIGMALAIMREDRRLPRNIKIISKTSIPPVRSVFLRLSMDLITWSEESISM